MTDDTLFTARNIGTLNSTVTFNDFVGNSDTVDYYRFDLSGINDLNISLTGLSGDADIRLIQDLDGDGVIDVGDGEVINSSLHNFTIPELLNLNNLNAGTYFVEVTRFNTNETNYTLRLSTAQPSNLIAEQENLGNLSATVIARTDFIGNIDTSDIYRFNLINPGHINVALTGLSADADVRLIRDANGNGIVDSEDAIAISSLDGTISEAINVNVQTPGTYFVQVFQSSAQETAYTLRLSNAIPNNLIVEEANLGNLSSTPVTQKGSVNDQDISDIYRFSLASTSDINVALTGLTADADVRVIRDANGNGVIDSGEVIASSELNEISVDSINLNNQAAGDYFVQVYNFVNDSTNYTVSLSNAEPSNLIAVEDSFGTLSTTPKIGFEQVTNKDTSDFFSFNLASIGDINIALTDLKADADMRVIRDVNGNGIVDSGDEIAHSSFSQTTSDSINLNNQAAGNYFVQVYQFSNNETSYTLRLSNAGFSNLIAEEDSLGNLTTNPITRNGFVGNQDTSDIYRFTLANTSDINIALTGLSSDADIRLIRDANGNGIVDAGEDIAKSQFFASTPDSINLNKQAAGTYFVQVYQIGSNETNYTLRMSNVDTSFPLNNLIAEEKDLGTISNTPTMQVGFIGDSDTSDIYRFNLASVSDLNLTLTGLNDDPDIRLIRDSNGNGIVDSGDSIANAFDIEDVGAASINLNNQAAGSYFVQVNQHISGDTNYTLRLSTASPSNLLAEQENFGTLVGGSAVMVGITEDVGVSSKDTSDIYHFSLLSTHTVKVTLDHLNFDANLRLIADKNHNKIFDTGDSAFSVPLGGTNPETITASLGFGDYYAQVFQAGDLTANYHMTVSVI